MHTWRGSKWCLWFGNWIHESHPWFLFLPLPSYPIICQALLTLYLNIDQNHPYFLFPRQHLDQGHYHFSLGLWLYSLNWSLDSSQSRVRLHIQKHNHITILFKTFPCLLLEIKSKMLTGPAEPSTLWPTQHPHPVSLTLIADLTWLVHSWWAPRVSLTSGHSHMRWLLAGTFSPAPPPLASSSLPFGSPLSNLSTGTCSLGCVPLRYVLRSLYYMYHGNLHSILLLLFNCLAS